MEKQTVDRWQVLADMAYALDGMTDRHRVAEMLTEARRHFPEAADPVADFPGFAVSRLLTHVLDVLAGDDAGAAEVTTDEYFGGCPKCGKSSGYLNVHKSHYGTCEEHKAYWPIGSGLFSSWLDETESDWQRNRELLSTYEEVTPIRAAPPYSEEELNAFQRGSEPAACPMDDGFDWLFG